MAIALRAFDAMPKATQDYMIQLGVDILDLDEDSGGVNNEDR